MPGLLEWNQTFQQIWCLKAKKRQLPQPMTSTHQRTKPLPQEGTFDVILDSQNQAVCIVEITKVSVQPFYQVSAEHAYKEGEGDKSLAYWRQVHEDFFKDCLGEAGLTFTPESKVVLEEFSQGLPLVKSRHKKVFGNH